MKTSKKKTFVIDIHQLKWVTLALFLLALLGSTVVGLLKSFNEEDIYPILSIVFNTLIVCFHYISDLRLGYRSHKYHLILWLSSVLIVLTFLWGYTLILSPLLFILGIYLSMRFVSEQESRIEPHVFQRFMLISILCSWVLCLYLLMVKTTLLIVLIPVFVTFFYFIAVASQMIKRVEQRQYVFFISIMSLILMYLSTDNNPLGSQYYHLTFDLNMIIIFILSLLHLPYLVKLFKA